MVVNRMNTPPDSILPTHLGTSAAQVPAKPRRPLVGRGCLWSLFVVLVFGVLAGLVLPLFGSVCVRGSQTKALAQAKQIGLALKLFASDNNGNYPRQGNPVEIKDVPPDSNTAFACLFPTYVTSERIFGNKLSAYQTGPGPDDIIDNPYTGHPVQTLRPGENVYGYVMGLTDDAPPTAPLVVDGTDGSGHYNKAQHIRGGTWWEHGSKAVVIHMDNSGEIATLLGPDNTFYLPRAGDPTQNALKVNYLGKNVRYLDPAIPAP